MIFFVHDIIGTGYSGSVFFTPSRHYDEGEIIATEGEAAREWFILLKGVVHAETLFGTCLYRVDPGAAFGEV